MKYQARIHSAEAETDYFDKLECTDELKQV